MDLDSPTRFVVAKSCNTEDDMGAPVRIRIDNLISRLSGLDNALFAERIQLLKKRLSSGEPQATLIVRSIETALGELAERPDRNVLLSRLLTQKPVQAAREALRRVTSTLPRAGAIRCYLLPKAGDRGSGNCFRVDRLIVAAPCEGDATSWLRFVICHEYSHTHRAFGKDEAETVRECLIEEGLAMVFAETVFPKPEPYPWDDVIEQEVADFWTGVDPEARGLEAYVQYLSNDAAYEIGARIVRSYLQNHGISIVQAHRLSNAELYWESGYPLLR